MNPHNRRPIRTLLVAFIAAFAATSVTFAADDNAPLPRRGVIGLAIQPGDAGGVVTALRPDGPAALAGVRVGDELLSIDGVVVKSMDELGTLMRAGGNRAVTIRVRRDGEQLDLAATLGTAPAEQIAGSTIAYDSVRTAAGYRLRTIVTTPDQSPLAVEGRHPAFLFVQGIYCASLDRPQVPDAVDTRLVHALANAGFVTLRVDKAGLGDSEGPPCSEINFEEELSGYRAALAHLSQMPSVDPSRIYVFGHSMGGVMAPYLASETPVTGTIVYGTLVRTWFEYQLENTRRQMELAGASAADVSRAVQAEAITSSMILVEKKTMGDVWERYPELRSPSPMVDENHLASRHMSFYHQLQDLNLAQAWSTASGSVLAIHGEYDWVTSWDDHQRIAQIVNEIRPGAAEAVSLPKADHAFTVHENLDASFRAMGQGTWDGTLPTLVLNWIAKLEHRAPSPTAPAPTVPAGSSAAANTESTSRDSINADSGNTNALPQWTILNTERYPGKQDDIFFVSSTTGWYANGAGKIFKTTDAGQTWAQQAHMPGTYFRCLAFLDEHTGFAGNIGPGYFPNVTDQTVLYRTDDGGQTWNPVEGINNSDLVGLCAIEIVREPFVNAGVLDQAVRIVAVGRVGSPAAMIVSDDMGKTWQNVSIADHTAMAFDVHFFDRNHGIIAGASNADVTQSNARIIATDDGGRTWRTVYQSDRPYELTWKISFPTRDVGYVTVQSYDPDPSATKRVVAKTTDGGKTWSEVQLSNDPRVREFGVAFVDERRGWIGAMPNGFQTLDGGATWTPTNFGNAVNKIRLLREGNTIHAFAIGVNVATTSLPAQSKE